MKQAVVLLLFLSLTARAQSLYFHPAINSIGLEIQGAEAYDSCHIEFKKASETFWKAGMAADKVTVSGQLQFRGSLMLLDENTEYQLRIHFDNALPLPVQNVKTLSAPVFTPTANVKWVSPNGSGNAYTQAQPGNITALLSSGQVTCGVTIMLMDGVYTQLGNQLSINTDCDENKPIQLLAAPGAHPVFDGAVKITSTWTQHASDPKLFYTAIPPAAAHSNICVFGDRALYPYPSIAPEVLLGNYNLSALNFGFDGFVRDENTIWIKTQAGTDPDTVPVVLSSAFRFLTVYGNGHNAWLKIKGIGFRHIGKPQLNPLGSADNSYGATVFDLRKVHQVYFDSCRFEFNTANIDFSDVCSDIFIQNCHFKHDTGKWTHAMIKKSHVFVHSLFYTVSSSRARDVENADIFLDQTRSVVIRNNVFDGMNSGVESYIDKGPNEEVDIYGNTFIDNFDAIECDGYWTNLRVWNNEVIRPMSGISAAPPLLGPRYFYRNVFHHMQGRRNEQDDPYFIECYPPLEYKLQGIGIKTNSGVAPSPERGNLYFFNNTFYAEDTLGFGFSSWDSEWREAYFTNNIFYQNVKNPGYFASLADKPDFQWHSERDNFYSPNALSPILVAKHIHGQYDCSDIYAVEDIQATLRSISGSHSISFVDPLQENPQFASTLQGGFQLKSNSSLIDTGVLIPGFYDFWGQRPDVGAKEFIPPPVGTTELPAAGEVTLFPNPACERLQFILHEAGSVTGLSVYNTLGQAFTPRFQKEENGYGIDLSGLKSGIYLLQIRRKNLPELQLRFLKACP